MEALTILDFEGDFLHLVVYHFTDRKGLDNALNTLIEMYYQHIELECREIIEENRWG